MRGWHPCGMGRDRCSVRMWPDHRYNGTPRRVERPRKRSGHLQEVHREETATLQRLASDILPGQQYWSLSAPFVVTKVFRGGSLIINAFLFSYYSRIRCRPSYKWSSACSSCMPLGQARQSRLTSFANFAAISQRFSGLNECIRGGSPHEHSILRIDLASVFALSCWCPNGART
jgi:hypothetical protein